MKQISGFIEEKQLLDINEVSPSMTRNLSLVKQYLHKDSP